MVYVLAKPEHMAHAEQVVRVFAKDDHAYRLKEGTRLVDALNPRKDDCDKIGGWLELDNLFWFFTDKQMFKGVCALFGVKE